MTTVNQDICPPGNKVKNALKWVSEELRNAPHKSRAQLLGEAELRFDLSPLECEFLDRNFCEQGEKAAS